MDPYLPTPSLSPEGYIGYIIFQGCEIRKATEGILLQDAVVKSYVIATKRLAVYHQVIHPPEDIAKRMINF